MFNGLDGKSTNNDDISSLFYIVSLTFLNLIIQLFVVYVKHAVWWYMRYDIKSRPTTSNEGND